jgi:hypothetical protein
MVIAGMIIDRCGSRGRRYRDRQRITIRFDYSYCASRVWRDEERACGQKYSQTDNMFHDILSLQIRFWIALIF